MRTVEVNLTSDQLSDAMAEMRLWLDERRFEPSVFSCRDVGACVLVRVDFKVAGEAAAFADRFSGRVDGGAAIRSGDGRIPDISSALSPEGVVG